jgi:hypothetical protein
MNEPEKEPPVKSVMQEIIECINLAKNEGKNCELVTNFPLALKVLNKLGYKHKPFKEGVIVQFEKKGKIAQIYVHGTSS